MKLNPLQTGASTTKLIGWSCRIPKIAFLSNQWFERRHTVNFFHPKSKNIASHFSIIRKIQTDFGSTSAFFKTVVVVSSFHMLIDVVFSVASTYCLLFVGSLFSKTIPEMKDGRHANPAGSMISLYRPP